MATKNIYLAGPIAGCDIGEANDWRKLVRSKFSPGIVGISPLRCEPLVSERYQLVYDDPRFGTAKAISSKNLLDVQNCDMVLMYMPMVLNARRPSYGTTIEFGWASAFRKPVILVTDDPTVYKHPLFSENAGWILDNLDEAVEVINGIWAAYVEKEVSSQ